MRKMLGVAAMAAMAVALSHCGDGQCNRTDSAACPAGQKCTLGQTVPLTWVCAAAGAKGDLEACASDAECKVGYGCLPDATGTLQHCHAWCAGDADCPQAGGAEACSLKLTQGNEQTLKVACDRAQ
jgi:hypothetical protein